MSRFDDDDDEDITSTKSTKSRVDDDEDESVDTKPPAPKARTIKRGWGAADKAISSTSAFAQNWRPTADSQLIKFVEDEPYASWHQHWITRSGQQSFVCIANEDPKGCPLCDAGHRPGSRFAFNIAVIDQNGDEPVLRSYELGPQALEQLKNLNNQPQTGPIDKHYWSVALAGKKKNTNFNMVKERDITDGDWGDAVPVTPEQLASLRKAVYTESTVRLPSRKDLLVLAAEELGTE